MRTLSHETINSFKLRVHYRYLNVGIHVSLNLAAHGIEASWKVFEPIGYRDAGRLKSLGPQDPSGFAKSWASGMMQQIGCSLWPVSPARFLLNCDKG